MIDSNDKILDVKLRTGKRKMKRERERDREKERELVERHRERKLCHFITYSMLLPFREHNFNLQGQIWQCLCLRIKID